MIISRLTNYDIGIIGYLQPDGWPDITDAFRMYCNYDFCNPIKVVMGKDIVGIGCSIIYGNTAWLAHIIVSSNHRKRGIGYKIVDYLLADIMSRGIVTTFLIATELGEPVYQKAGFRMVSDYCYFTREIIENNGYESNRIKPYRDDFYNDIMQLDTLITGENREELLKGYISNSLVHISNGVVDGFYIPGLGEGPILSLTVDAARYLLQMKYSVGKKATIPKENHAGVDIIKGIGFKETKSTGRRMVLGNDIEWKPEMIYSRIGGNFG